MQDYVRKQIDRYRITERLGMGCMAVVYKAYDTRLERDVALKMIRTDSIPQDQHERLLKRFEREAKSQARFLHPNIITIHDYGEVDGAPYLVMEFMPGGTLKDRFQAPVDWQQAVELIIPIIDALRYAHNHHPPTIHRDINPGNILFDEEERPILTDFGIAKILETNEATHTRMGIGVGTTEYMAPEQWQGHATEASDQYALGVVLYELLTGQKPFIADTPLAVELPVMTDPLVEPSSAVPDVPEELEKVLDKMLSRNPMDRYEDMGSLKNSLAGLMNGVTSKIEAPERKYHSLIKLEPMPEVDSEGETGDVLDPTPVEVHAGKQAVEPERQATESRKRMPKWLLWTGAGIVLFFILFVGRSIFSAPVVEDPTEESLQVTKEIQLPNIVDQMSNRSDEAEMVYVPEGDFLMGSEEGDSDESPEHTVYLDAYWIYRHEVTNAQFAAFLNSQGFQIESGVTWLDQGAANIHQLGNEWVSFTGYENHPVVEVSWYGAQAYCEWAGGRLPTEAEWEKAARGTDGRSYPWGEESPTCNLAQYGSCSGFTVAVGSYPNGASTYGALDMAGNVWEWVSDWYDPDYYGTQSNWNNPSGPTSGTYRVIRGGSWKYSAGNLRSSGRKGGYPGGSSYSGGFRCFLSP